MAIDDDDGDDNNNGVDDMVEVAGPDTDSDGTPDTIDAFPGDPTESVDSDADGVGNNADVFPLDPMESMDTDADGVGDNADAFPNDPTETIDINLENAGKPQGMPLPPPLGKILRGALGLLSPYLGVISKVQCRAKKRN